MIREAVPSDAHALSAFINRAYRGESSKSGWTTEADFLDGTRTHPDLLLKVIESPESSILLLFGESHLEGCVEIRRDGDELYLGMLTVDPEKQGKGLGKQLMKEAESRGRAMGCTSVYMTVITRRHELISWYERHGYVNTGETRPFEFSDPRFGQPKIPLEFTVLRKGIV